MWHIKNADIPSVIPCRNDDAKRYTQIPERKSSLITARLTINSSHCSVRESTILSMLTAALK